MQRQIITSIVCCVLILSVVSVIGCGDDDDDGSVVDQVKELSASKIDPNWRIQSTAFDAGGEIPQRFSCDGGDISPSLSWSEAPVGTKSLALLMEDPDAPDGTFTHWMLYDLPSDVQNLVENLPKQPPLNDVGNAKQGINDFGDVGYGGPCPPRGSTHLYRFRLFALDIDTLGLPSSAERMEIVQAIENHIIAEAQLTGRFGR